MTLFAARSCLIALLLPTGMIAPPALAGAPIAKQTTRIVGDVQTCTPSQTGEVQVCGHGVTPADIVNLHVYAACLASHHGHAAVAAVHAYVERGVRDDLRALAIQDKWCRPHGASRISGILLAGALVERLPGWQHLLREGFAEQSPATDLVGCLIATDGRATMAMLRSPPLSDDEGHATSRLMATLPSCVPTGMRLETHRAAIRSVLALALYEKGRVTFGADGAVRADGQPPLTAVAISAPGAGQPIMTRTVTFAPTLAFNGPPAPVQFIPRISANHLAPDLPKHLFPDEIMDAQMDWPIDPDTGDTPSEDRRHDLENVRNPDN